MKPSKKTFAWGRPSESAAEDLVTIGQLAKPQGLKGEMRCRPETDFPERFLDTEEVDLFSDTQPPRRIRIEGARLQQGIVLVKLEGIDSVEAAEQMRGLWVGIRSDEVIELEEGEYFHYELEGLEVFDENGAALGILDKVLENPAHEIYQIQGPAGVWLLPAVEEFVLDIDLESKRMVVRPPVYDED